MRRATITLTTLTFLLMPAATFGDLRYRHAVSAKCASGHKHRIAADAQAQVFAVRESPFGEDFQYVGCAYGQKKWFVIGGTVTGDSQVSESTSHVTLAGPIVAYETSFSVGDGSNGSRSEFTVQVCDLRTGKLLHKVPTGTPKVPPPGLVGVGETTAIVVKPDGAVAWIVESEMKPKAEYEVHALDKSGSRVLASGADIAPKSLALAGSTLYWTQGGKPFSEPLN